MNTVEKYVSVIVALITWGFAVMFFVFEHNLEYAAFNAVGAIWWMLWAVFFRLQEMRQ